ncbi:MAG: DUF3014 domain-containing protein [Deltaproteobacteria bacterium]|nr:DUF3014 domain-containing protein [Deltaproteobacteria bacterium]
MEESAKVKLISLAVVLLAAGAGAWVYMFTQVEVEEPKPVPVVDGKPQVEQSVPAAMPAPAPMAPNPVVAQVEGRPDDARIRELSVGLNAEPEWVHWLATEHLLDKFVASVENVANGQSPRKLVPFLAPEGRFLVFEREGKEYIDPKGYARYDRLALAFDSLEVAGTVRVLGKLMPWLEKGYAEMGRPERRFKQALSEAVQQLIDVPSWRPTLNSLAKRST